MRTVFISASKIPSDTANSIQVMKVCQSFKQLGHEVTLLVPGPQPASASPENLRQHYGLQADIDIHWLPVRSRRFFPWMAVSVARRLRPDLLYAWPLQSGVLALVAGLPTMLELHDFPGGTFGPVWLRLFMLLPGRKRLLPITEALRKALHLHPGISQVAPDGVDLERYDKLPDPAAARKQLGLPAALTVLCTGHLYDGRGVKLFNSLAKAFPDTSFIWVGGRPAEVERCRQAAAADELKNILFTGFVPNLHIPLYQAAADVLLMPYHKTIATSSGGDTSLVCSPMKMFEYMAAGRAILSSDLLVLREVLDESTAAFCPPEDAGAWQAALQRLLEDAPLRQRLGRKAHQAVKSYSWIERSRRVLADFL
jgi:glycosyltransferase involved in cell wall biosynthesis